MLSRILLVTLCCSTAYSAVLPNVNATFGDRPQPFVIDVDPAFIKTTRQKVADFRAPINIESFPYNDGPVAANLTSVQQHWVNGYDWNNVQASINDQLRQFTTTVRPNSTNYTEPVPLHFVHHRSVRADAIPLLFVHGWPGNFLEVRRIIDRLTNPPNTNVPAFHVVAPSIPGFGFSPAPVKPGFGPIAAGHAFDALMQQLNYTKYVAQAGDWGGIIIRFQAFYHPENLVSLLDNFWLIQPNSTDLARYAANETTAMETAYINGFSGYLTQGSGYRFIQQTRPLTLAYAMTDSSLGFAMWLEDLFRHSTDLRVYSFSPDEIITWRLMLYIQGPYGGFRFYKEGVADGVFADFGFGSLPYVKVPTAIAEFPYDIWYNLPLDWAQRGGNVLKLFYNKFGDHLAATDVPEILADNIWTWFGDRELSGTKVFY